MKKLFDVQEYRPATPLLPFIERYWAMHIDSSAAQNAPLQKILPYAGTEMVFLTQGNAFVQYEHQLKQMPVASLCGQLDNHVELSMKGSLTSFCIRFKPGGLFHLLGVPAQDFKNDCFDLRDVFGREYNQLTEQLLDAPANEIRVLLANEFFLKKLHKESVEQPHYVFQLTDWIRTQPGQLTVSQVTKKAGYSERQLERAFREKVGYTPKFYLRIHRLDYAFRLLRQRPETGWAELAYDCGFTDQAHFIKEFKSFAGQPPAAYFANQPELSEVFQGSEVY